jgi:MraZ protein
VFLGTFTPRLDEKGRLILPAKWREELAPGLVMTKGQERCLYVFGIEEFRRLTARMREATLSARASREFSRVFFASATDELPDRQGRVPVPAALRTYAGLDRECTLAGADNRIEIWDTAAWEATQAEREEHFATLSETVMPGF